MGQVDKGIRTYVLDCHGVILAFFGNPTACQWPRGALGECRQVRDPDQASQAAISGSANLKTEDGYGMMALLDQNQPFDYV